MYRRSDNIQRAFIFLNMVIVILIILSSGGCISLLTKADVRGTGSYLRKLPIKVGGLRRSYLIHVPEDFNSTRSLPLLVVIHGAFSTAKEIERQSGFSELSDKEKFIVVYPNGAFGIFGFLQHWNAGHCCGRAASENIDDVGFLDRIIAEVGDLFNIDKSRIYMVGLSNGGMLTYRYASERSDTVAAIAAVAASIGGRASNEDPVWVIPEPASPVPLISFHGKEDQVVPYEGGISPRKGGTREYFSVEQSIGYWVQKNKCTKAPLTENLYNGMITRHIWSDCANHTDSIELFSIEEWGHAWPGTYFTDKLDDNHPLKGFDAAGIIWQFFSIHKRDVMVPKKLRDE